MDIIKRFIEHTLSPLLFRPKVYSSTNEFSELAQFVLNHHEKWDGSGYPNGLRGEAIQLEARIIAVADAYESSIIKSGLGIVPVCQVKAGRK